MALHVGIGRGPGHLDRLTRGSATAVAVTGDIIGLTVLDSTAITTTPTNNIDAGGWVAAVTVKGTAIGQTCTASKLQFTVSEPGFDSSGNATTVSRVVNGLHTLRMPVCGTLWTSGSTYTAGTAFANYTYSKSGGSNTTHLYRCTTAGGGTATNQPVHTTGSVTGADGYTWLFVSNTTQSDNPTQFPIETTANAGADAVIYVTLDKYVSSSATITGVAIASGFYTGSNASNSALVTTTNSSSFVPLKPHFAWITMPWQVFGNTLHVEAYADHPLGASGRTCAAMVFKVYDNANVDTGLSATVTAMTQSTNLTTTNGNAVPVYQADIDISTLTDGGLYSIRAIARPFIGAAWDSDTDGFGSAFGSWTSATKMPANNPKRIPFTKDASAYTVQYAFVDGVGAGTPAISTVLATARGTPFATYAAALNAAYTANGSVQNYKVQIYLTDGVSITGSGADEITGKTIGTSWLLVARDPAGVATTTINADTTTANNRRFGSRVKFQNLSIVTAGTSACVQNTAAASQGDFLAEMWFDKCKLTGPSTGAQQPISAIGWFSITNSLLTSTANMTGNTRSAWYLSAGNTITGQGTDSPVVTCVHNLGDKMLSRAIPSSSMITSWWNDNSQLLDTQIVAFTSFPNSNGGGTTNLAAFQYQLTSGCSWSSNLIEANAVANKGGQLSADAIATTCGRMYLLYPTSAGDGINYCYNSVNTAQTKKWAIRVGVCTIDINQKSDWLDNTDTTTASPNRTGNWPGRYSVECSNCAIYAPTNSTGSPGSYVCEVPDATSAFTGTKNWTTDASKTGSSAGNGDYRPTSSGFFNNRVPVGGQLFPFDLNGTTRLNDGTGAAGAFEHT